MKEKDLKEILDTDSEYFNSNEPLGIDEREPDLKTEEKLIEEVEKEEREHSE